MDTTITSSTANQQEQDIFRTISLTSLLTSLLNISASIVHFYILNGTGPALMIKEIASGIFGKEAIEGGTLMLIWGVVFHFMIAFLFTAFLFLIYPKLAAWIKNKFVIAVLYGLFAWAVMNLVVVPLRITHQLPSDAEEMGTTAVIVISTIGLPVALIAQRFYARKKKS
jgi:hypothetical protein